jgi:epoxyqueuosine reductase
MAGRLNTQFYHDAARSCGFGLSGIAAALPHPDAKHYADWVDHGFAAQMHYLTDHRGDKRHDPRTLLPNARTILCLGMLYNGPEPRTDQFDTYECGWISRYAWGQDYHQLMWDRLAELNSKLQQVQPYDFKICCDTAPLLERTYAREAGLGWIGRNTCLIHEGQGSWFFLGEILTSLDLPTGTAPPDRCGTCHRCIEACPTNAIVPAGDRWEIDAGRCISYLTIELRGPAPEAHRSATGAHIFGCDICQDVCPWNRNAPITGETAFAAANRLPNLDAMAWLTEAQFRAMFRQTPVDRARYSGFLRNVATAMGNSGNLNLLEPLQHLALSPDAVVAEHARWAMERLVLNPRVLS